MPGYRNIKRLENNGEVINNSEGNCRTQVSYTLEGTMIGQVSSAPLTEIDIDTVGKLWFNLVFYMWSSLKAFPFLQISLHLQDGLAQTFVQTFLFPRGGIYFGDHVTFLPVAS